MKRTELREEFFAAYRTDPYVHAVTHHVASAWVDGYDQALRDHGLTDERLRKSHSERFEDAIEWLTEDRRKAQVQQIVALAELGKWERWMT